MLELILCSMLTILPDYLYRRLVQGKRFGKEITPFSIWFAASRHLDWKCAALWEC